MDQRLIKQIKMLWIKDAGYTHSSGMEISFSQILGQIMKERELNQLVLANMLGIRQSQISNWINGKSLPGYYSIKLLCDKLKINADQLFK